MTEPHPIRQRIRGIDSNHRDLNSEEIAQLTRPGPEPGRGDWFAQWLARVPVEQRQLSLRSFLTQALDPERGFYQSFAVADGTSIVYDRENEDNPLNSVSRHLRFVTIVLPDTRADRGALAQHAIKERTLCLVSSPDPDDVQAFFQCASWDPHAFGSNQGLMRFYEREAKRGWVFVGDSYHAFNSQTLNLGPFDGHIGGVMIMKELRRPWMHWFDITNVNEFQRSLGSTREAGSRADPNNALHDPLFAGPARAAFSLLGRAETLESVVTNSITRWYSSRFRRDFLEPGSTNPLPEITAQIKQWIAHILVNRSMNIVTSATSTAQVQMNADIGRVPITLFYNAKAFERLLPSVGGETESITISNALYTTAVRKLGISIYYDTPGDDGSTGGGPYGTGPIDGSQRKIAVEHTEGPFPFPAIEPGIEDYQAIRTLLRPRPRLISEKGIAALLMVDFCNPMYSPRREALMEYLPKAAKYDPQTQSYDVLEQFIANVKQSPKSTDPESAEHEVLQLLDTPDDTYVEVFTRRINDYIAKIRERVTNPNSAEAAVEDYMTLAEGRRRTYRRLENGKPDGTGLDEFVLTLPFAARPNPFPIMEMTETGEVRVMQGKSVYGVAAAKCPAMRGGAA